MDNVIPFKRSGKLIYEGMPCQAFATRPKQRVPLYNVYKDNRLVYGSATFAQCTRFLGMLLGDPDGIVTVGEMMKAGYSLKALPL